MANTASHRPSCVCDVRNAAKAVPAASALGSRFFFLPASSERRPENTRLRTMFNAHTRFSFVTAGFFKVSGECFRTSSNAASSSFLWPSAARATAGYCSRRSSSSLHWLRRSNCFGSWSMYVRKGEASPRLRSCSRFRATFTAHLFCSVSFAHSSFVQNSGKGSSASSMRTRHDSRGSSTSTSPTLMAEVALTPRYRITSSSTSPKYATSTFGDLMFLDSRHDAYSACCASTAEADARTSARLVASGRGRIIG